MNDNDVIGGLLGAFLAATGVMFLLGFRSGYDDGVTDGKNEGIVYCMEKPIFGELTYETL
jgi:hypothetical protein